MHGDKKINKIIGHAEMKGLTYRDILDRRQNDFPPEAPQKIDQEEQNTEGDNEPYPYFLDDGEYLAKVHNIQPDSHQYETRHYA